MSNGKTPERLIDEFNVIRNLAVKSLNGFITESGGIAHERGSLDIAFKSTLRTAEALQALKSQGVDISGKEKVVQFAQDMATQSSEVSGDLGRCILDGLRWQLFVDFQANLEAALKGFSDIVTRVENRNFYRTSDAESHKGDSDCDHVLFLNTLYKVVVKWERLPEGSQPKDLKSIKEQVSKRCMEEVYKQYALYASGAVDGFDLGQMAFALNPAIEYLPRQLAEKAISAATNAFSIYGARLFSPIRIQSRDHHVRPIWQEVISVISDAAIVLFERYRTLAPFIDDLNAGLIAAAELAQGSYLANQNGWPRIERPTEAELWPSLAVLEMSINIDRLIRLRALLELREQFGFRLENPAAATREFKSFSSLPFNVYETLDKNFVRDHKPLWSSAILFGPPGTGKTTLVKALAKAKGWWFVGITPADVAQDGPDKIVLRARDLLQRLAFVENAVILFDEFDPFILSREDKEVEWFSLVTNCMLPLLAELRESQRSIFILATNFVDRLDPAATREGRFDAVLPIWVPALEERKRIIDKFLPKGHLVTIEQQDSIAQNSKWASWGEIKQRSQNQGPWTGYDIGQEKEKYMKQLAKSRPPVNAEMFD